MGIFKGKEIFTIKPWLTDYKQNVEQLKKILGLSSDNMLPAIEEGDEGKVVGVSSGKYALVEGGGGSSDFSTAEVTLDLTVPSGVTPDGTGLFSAVVSFPDYDHGYTTDYIPSNNSKVTILLYQGHGYVAAAQMDVLNENPYYLGGADATLTGNATYDEEIGVIDITGNCTISGTPTQ